MVEAHYEVIDMTIVKVLKSKFGNRAFKLFVDDEEVLTLREGMSSKIDLKPGKHKVYFKATEWLGPKSNKIIVNVNSSSDLITIECNPSYLSGVTASVSVEKERLQYFEARCNFCGWKGVKQSKDDLVCEYCGNILSITSQSER